MMSFQQRIYQLPTQVSTPTPRRPLVCRQLFTEEREENDGDERKTCDVGVNTDLPDVEKIGRG